MSQLRAILFDVGNTLHHVDHAWIAQCLGEHGHATTAREVAAAEYPAKAAMDEMFRARRAGNDATRQAPYLEIVLDTLGVEPRLRAAVGAALRAENARHSLWRVQHDDTPEVLAALRARGLTLGVVSNADGRVPAALERGGIAAHFAAIIDSHLVGVEKPDPRIFQLALEACGVAPQEALFVGDIYEIDVTGARAAGMEAVLIDPLDLYGEVDCRRISALRELLEIV
ncbi:MAG: HAD family hydrolase [Deltaproteobacteria bacterium]|nr:HAD family hydrolase [Deltaproteobacteria bacterium]